jgi:hypothetical protein
MRGSSRRQFRQILFRYPTGISSCVAAGLKSRSDVQVSPRTICRARSVENYHPVYLKLHWKISESQAACRHQYACAYEYDN